LKRLNPRFDGVVNLTIYGLAVTRLMFNTDAVKDNSPVRALRYRDALGCRGTPDRQGRLVDLAPFRGLALSRLHVEDNPVSDLSPLEGMPLRDVGLFRTRVQDLSPLRGMPLTSLGIGHTNVSDLSPLSGMALTHLVDRGDGTGDTFMTGGAKMHVYADGGTYAITVDLVDEDRTHTDRDNALSVNVTVNGASTLTVPAAQTAYEDVDLAISGITLGDPDGGNLTVNLSVGHGTLRLGTTAGLTVSGNGTGAVTLSGDIAALDAALGSVLYRGSLNFSGIDIPRIYVSDGSLSSGGSVPITVFSAF
jgi:hypothetical protein